MQFIKPDIDIDFVGKINIGLAISTIFIVISLASVFMHGGVNMGIDFTGGSLIQVKFHSDATDAKKIKKALAPMDFKTIDVQQYGDAVDNEFLIRVSRISDQKEGLAGEMKATLEKSYGAETVDIRSSEMVGPKVGAELRSKGVSAIIAAIISIFFYVAFRFEFKLASGAIVALIHDVIITVGVMSIANKEFNLTIIAALLTVVGYSINDTVVVYDRIRENLRKTRKKKFEQVVNKSINETLSRTVLTSLTTFLVLLCIFLFGGGVIHNFAFAMIIGLLVGTYSSIFVASPIVVVWQRKVLGAKSK